MPIRIAHLVLTLQPLGGTHESLICFDAQVTSLAPEEYGLDSYRLQVVVITEQAATHEEAVAAVLRTLSEHARSNDSYKLIEALVVPKQAPTQRTD